MCVDSTTKKEQRLMCTSFGYLVVIRLELEPPYDPGAWQSSRIRRYIAMQAPIPKCASRTNFKTRCTSRSPSMSPLNVLCPSLASSRQYNPPTIQAPTRHHRRMPTVDNASSEKSERPYGLSKLETSQVRLSPADASTVMVS